MAEPEAEALKAAFEREAKQREEEEAEMHGEPAPKPEPEKKPEAAPTQPSAPAQPQQIIIQQQAAATQKPSFWSKAFGYAASKVYTNVSMLGLAGFLILAIETFNLFTQYSFYTFRIFSEVLIIFLLVIAGTSIPGAFGIAFLDFLVPTFLINIIIQKTPPPLFSFIGPLLQYLPNFPDLAQRALTVLIAALSPALIFIFLAIRVQAETKEILNLYRIARGFYSIVLIVSLLVFFFATAAWAGVDFAKPIAEIATLTPHGRETVANAWQFVVSSPKVITEGIGKLWQQQIQIATGGDYYAGQVEQANEKPTGVTITSFKAENENNIVENQKTYFYADIDVLTLPEKPISIKTSCVSDNLEGKTPIPGATTPSQFDVELKRKETVQCYFDKGLPRGTRNVNFTAEFDFHTESFNRAYFIDRQRLIDLQSRNINPYDQYPVPDRNPVTTYTQGPVGIGMNIVNPIGVSTNPNVAPPTLGVTLENKWRGKITNLKNLYLYVPQGTGIRDNSCGVYEFVNEGEQDIKGYNRYKLTNSELISEGLRQTYYQTFICQISFTDASTLLKNERGEAVPLATKFFFVVADYTFALVSTAPVNVKSPPTPSPPALA